MQPVIELLARHHNRAGFSCGKPALDAYFDTRASQDVKRRQATVLVLCEKAGASDVMGYFTITSSSMLLTAIAPEMAKGLPYPEIPATLVGRLAVDARYAGRGFGTYMLFDAAARAMSPNAPASWALLVDPIDDEAAGWYRHLGFLQLEGHVRMFIPLAMISRALKAQATSSR